MPDKSDSDAWRLLHNGEKAGERFSVGCTDRYPPAQRGLQPTKGQRIISLKHCTKSIFMMLDEASPSSMLKDQTCVSHHKQAFFVRVLLAHA